MLHLSTVPKNFRNPILTAMAISTLGVIFYILSAFFRLFDNQVDDILSSLELTSLNFIFFILSCILARRLKQGRHLHAGWLLIGLAGLSNVLAEAIWFFEVNILKIDPFPSLADLFYLLYYLLMLVGLLSFPSEPMTRQERRMLWLDLSIFMVACATLLWYLILGPISLASEQGLAGLVSLIYPVGDLLLLVGVAALIQRDFERINTWVLMLLGMGAVSMVLSDFLFSYYETYEIPYRLTYLNLGWLVSALLQIFAAGCQLLSRPMEEAKPEMTTGRSRNWLRLTLPYLAVAGVIIFLIEIFNVHPLSDTSLRGFFHGTMVLVALVMYRQYAALRQNKDLFEKMRQQASTDSMTDLYNRHFFNERFPEELKRAARYQRPLTVLLVDVDGFKRINDTLGHLKGDQVLKVVAQTLTTQLRSTDLLARFGGDEFVILLPETDEKAAGDVAERLKEAVATHQVAGVKLGVSIGMTIARSGATPEQLLEEVDRELYRQKGIIL
jgi:diguanylate cyclase (GGDEF)-like protein